MENAETPTPPAPSHPVPRATPLPPPARERVFSPTPETESRAAEDPGVPQEPEVNEEAHRAAQSDTEPDREGDETLIARELTHIPDRDQLFQEGHKAFPTADGINEDWSGDLEDSVTGDRDFKGDALDEIADASLITGSPTEDAAPAYEPTPVGKELTGDVDAWDDAVLRDMAESLGVPGREAMARPQLVEAVREAIDRTH